MNERTNVFLNSQRFGRRFVIGMRTSRSRFPRGVRTAGDVLIVDDVAAILSDEVSGGSYNINKKGCKRSHGSQVG